MHVQNCQDFEITVVLVMGIVILMVTNGIIVAIDNPVLAQANTNGNMTGPMMDSASFHLRAADELLTRGDTKAAVDQINLAEIQLSLLNMGSQGTSMNSSQAIEFITGGSLSSSRMAANCIIDNRAMASCMR